MCGRLIAFVQPSTLCKGGQTAYDNCKRSNKKGYAIANEGDSINLEQPNSKTRRGRVGKGVAQTITTQCNQAVAIKGDSSERKQI